MTNENYLYIFFIILNALLFLNISKINKYLNVYDEPDNIRKFHKQSVPLLGGVFFFLNLLFILLLTLLNEINTNFFSYNTETIFLLLLSFFSFLIGYYDDKFNLKPLKKLILLSLIISFFLYLNPENNLLKKFSIFSWQIELSFLTSLIFTVLCYLLFINAFNMIDGMNLVSSCYFLSLVIFFLLGGILIEYCLIFLIFLIFYIYYNFKNKLFYGDSGTILISVVLSFIFIKSYNLTLISYTEQILLLMLLPGLDMFRLFLTRIIKKKSPFMADRSHFHHLLLKNFGESKAFIIFIFFQSFLVIQSYYIVISFEVILLEIIFFYLLIFNLKIK